MQVKLNTHHWGTQWNSMVMQVKKATFQRMGRVELKIDGLHQVQDSLHHRKHILYFHGKYIKKSQRLTVRATIDVPGDTKECCSVSENSIKCYFTPSRTYTSNPTRRVNTNYHNPLPCPLPVTVCWNLMPCPPNYTAPH